MHFNVPLLPYRVVIGHGVALAWRPLPRPRLRFTVRGLLVLVAVSGGLLALVSDHKRNNALATYHSEEFDKIADADAPPRPVTPTAFWHLSMMQRHQDAAEWEESVLGFSIMVLGWLGTIGLAGRLIDRRFREEIADGAILDL